MQEKNSVSNPNHAVEQRQIAKGATVTRTLDECSAAEILDALMTQREIQGVEYPREGLRILRELHDAGTGGLTLVQANERRTLNHHLGWICNRVAEALGVHKTGSFLLCDRFSDREGK